MIEQHKWYYLLYWLPMVICLIGYNLRLYNLYKRDLINREAALNYEKALNLALKESVEVIDQFHRENLFSGYHPKLSYGMIFGYLFICLCPVINLIAAIVDIVGKEFLDYYYWIEDFLYKPVVPMIKEKT